MDPGRRAEIDRLVEEVADLPPAEQDRFLDLACGGDAQLRVAVLQQVRPDARAGSVLPGQARAGEGAAMAEADRVAAQEFETETMAAAAAPFPQLERYQIIGTLGSGAMGQVYHAVDRQLNRPVALKLLRSDQTHQVHRFQHEARTQANLDHPNICRIYEVGEANGRPFIAMQLIKGEPLSRLAERLSTEDKVRLTVQVAQALQAAHRAGVIHRDVKPGNIMVDRDDNGALRAVLLDFGIARLVEAPGMTATGQVLGTPAYMAPEQAQCRSSAIDHRVDLYSLGATLYTLLAGRAPFGGTSQIEVLLQVLNEEPQPLRQLEPDIPADLETIVARCLEKEPQHRFPSAQALADELQRFLAGEPIVTRRTGVLRRLLIRARRHRAMTAVTLVAAVLALVVTGLVLRLLASDAQTGSGRAVPQAQAVHTRRCVAVLGFRDLSDRSENAWLSTALSEMLTTELASTGELRTIPGENVARMKRDLALAETYSLAPETLTRIRTHLGADLLVVGSYLHLGERGGNKIRLDVQLQDAGARETIASFSRTGDEAELFGLVAQTGGLLRERLGIGRRPAEQVARARAAWAGAPEGARLWAEGLERLRHGDALTARDSLLSAVNAVPDNALAHQALAEAWNALGYQQKAQEEARRAFELAEGLSREELLGVEATYRRCTDERQRVLKIYQTLWTFFPDNAGHGRNLAAWQIECSQVQEALATIRELRQLPTHPLQDLEIRLLEASAADSLSDLRRARDLYAGAVRMATDLGARLLLAGSLRGRGEVLYRLGELEEAHQTLDEAADVFSQAGDLNGRAEVVVRIAKLLADEGDFGRSLDRNQEALALFVKIGNRDGEVSALSGLAEVLWRLDRIAEAQEIDLRILEIHRETENLLGTGQALHNLAMSLRDRGDLAEAEQRFREAIEILPRTGNRLGLASSRTALSVVLFLRGELAHARELNRQTLAVARETGSKLYELVALYRRGQFQLEAADLAGARESWNQAMALQDSDPSRTLNVRLMLAVLAWEEGRWSEAERSGLQLAGAFAEQERIGRQIQALEIVARSRLAAGRLAAANVTLGQIEALLERTQMRIARLGSAITRARIMAASHRSEQVASALAILDETMVKARQSGHWLYAVEAELAMGEIEIAAGKAEAGRARLAEVEAAARSRGYERIARRAAASCEPGT